MSLGSRIRQFRTARGYSLDDLASRMDPSVSKQALSKYEKGDATPRPTVLLSLASALGVRASQLASEPEYDFRPVAFRALATLPQRERESIENTVIIELERRLSLGDRLGLDMTFPFEGACTEVSQIADAELAAAQLRAVWGLGDAPIASVVDSVEAHGGHLIEVDTPRKFDGLAIIALEDEMPVACGIATRLQVTRSRQRMSIAHEAGHLAMDVADGVDEEKAAKRFAGAFLYPEQAVRDEFGSIRTRITMAELLAAKARWGISMQGVLYRLHDLDVLDDAGYSWWCMYVNRAGWRNVEPAEEPKERSTWNETHARRAEAEGLIARETMIEYIPSAAAEPWHAGLDRRALMALPREERNAIIRAQVESISAEYNREIDHEWLDADLGEWDHEEDE
ncbi:MAG: XRE family transcriptional regulator [Coriobacteriia bacterium]|nr:XRE family transcriptional regulator [Coriobacteriia bacterium]